MSLRPSPSPSPGPNDRNLHARQSLGTPRGTPSLAPGSPRPGGIMGARPTSELLSSTSGVFQTPEAEALDQWFENLQNYEQTLEDMAAASLDASFKEELGAIDQWFKVLSEAERTAALYSLLQHSTQVQIRFFITVLQQMARSDPMTALLSPAAGSMQSQMEARLASMKSAGLKSAGLPASPSTRNFAVNRQSLALDSTSNFLTPDAVVNSPTPGQDPASTLAQQRAKLKATNPAHRVSAPVLASAGADGRSTWTTGPSLGQVAEQQGPVQEVIVDRPKSGEFSGLASPRPNAGNEATINASDSWASMVTTPLIPMFQKPNPPARENKANNNNNNWNSQDAVPGVPRMGDPTIYKKGPRGSSDSGHSNQSAPRGAGANTSGGWRNNNGGANGSTWTGARDGQAPNGIMPLNLGAMGMGSPIMGMPNLAGMTSPLSPFNMQMLNAMGITPEAQLLAAQMAASGAFGQAGWMGMQQPNSAGIGGPRGPPSGRSAGLRSASSMNSGLNSGGTPKAEEDVDPKVLEDIPAWLRSLRLHKYTPNFESMKWQDMVMMDESQLEAKGVAALGARRKMLKTFELVRKKMGIEGGPPSSLPPSATLKSP